MLVASLFFWDASHNTPMLFDIAAITGLRPTREDYELNYMDEDTIKLGESKDTYILYTAKHHNKDNGDVLEEEHISFLALWLSRYVFCSKFLQVAKRYFHMANQLNSRRKLGLSQMILSFLYELLDEFKDFLKTYEKGSTLLFTGPFWVLQLWLNATFKIVFPRKDLVDERNEEAKNRDVEGTRLSLLTPQD